MGEAVDSAILPWGLDSETGRLTEVLLGPPDHFDWRPVSAVARETLRRGLRFDAQRAMSQHRRMVEAYEAAGVRVRMLPVQEELKYQVFARDSSFMTPWGAVITMIQTPYRRGDYSAALRFYQAQGIPIWNMVSAGHFEGGDMMVLEPGLALCGYGGERSEQAGAEQVCGWFRAQGWEALAVPFPPYFVHLDVTVGPLAPKLVLLCEEAHESWFPNFLRERGYRTIPVSYGEAVALGCNVVALGDGKVLSSAHNGRVNDAIRAEGLEVIECELDMFTLGGGGPHCLCQGLARESL